MIQKKSLVHNLAIPSFTFVWRWKGKLKIMNEKCLTAAVCLIFLLPPSSLIAEKGTTANKILTKNIIKNCPETFIIFVVQILIFYVQQQQQQRRSE